MRCGFCLELTNYKTCCFGSRFIERDPVVDGFIFFGDITRKQLNKVGQGLEKLYTYESGVDRTSLLWYDLTKVLDRYTINAKLIKHGKTN